MLSILSDTEKAVVQTMTMKLLPTPAVQYLKDVGFKMSRATYFRYKKRVEGLKFERLKFIAEHFQDQHLEKLDKLELIENLMWENYHKETNPTKRVKILESIVNTQPYISSYYEATTIVLDSCNKNSHNNNDKNIRPAKFDEWTRKNEGSRIDDDSAYSDEENGQYYWNLHKKYKEYVKDWENQNSGLGPGEAWGTESNLPKAIVR